MKKPILLYAILTVAQAQASCPWPFVDTQFLQGDESAVPNLLQEEPDLMKPLGLLLAVGSFVAVRALIKPFFQRETEAPMTAEDTPQPPDAYDSAGRDILLDGLLYGLRNPKRRKPPRIKRRPLESEAPVSDYKPQPLDIDKQLQKQPGKSILKGADTLDTAKPLKRPTFALSDDIRSITPFPEEERKLPRS